MAEEFVGVEIAVIVVTASITLAAILIGLGRAFGYKRIEHFGIEELLQSVVNAAIIGSFAAVIELVAAVSSSLVTETCTEGNVVEQLGCALQNINDLLFLFFQELVKVLTLVGYYQTIGLDFGAFEISPFNNLAAVSGVLSVQLLAANLILLLVGLNIQITNFIGQNALALLFPVGLVLRTLFATRKVGGFLIALSIGLFLFYPTFVLIFPGPENDLSNSTVAMQEFNNNSYYATLPVVDLNDNYAIAGKLDIMSGRCLEENLSNTSQCNQTLIDYGIMENVSNVSNVTVWEIALPENTTFDFSGDITYITQSNNNALSKSLLYSVVAPIFSLLVTVVFVKELSNILGSEIGIKTLTAI
ncbi:hypothetical protein GF318_04635 [Candidatus Micrarchaeota archaeon]|nr:hypothetical protein [Candidatus Micrarchaeota archaeon]